MKLLLLGLILTVISVYYILVHMKKKDNKENLITKINYKSDPANDYWYRCTNGSIFSYL